MQAVSAAFLQALRGTHSLSVSVYARRNGATVATFDVVDGTVSMEATDRNAPRRTLSLEVVPTLGLWDAIAQPGTQVIAERGVRFIDGTIERVRLGTFDLEEAELAYGPEGTLSITCPDVWVRVQRARFETPRTAANGTVALDLAVSLAAEAIGLGTGLVAGDTSATIKRQTWPRDREDAIKSLSSYVGAWVFTDSSGRVVARDIPKLSATPAWTVDASASGVLLSASRNRSRQRTYNVVVVASSATDGTPPFTPVVLADTDPNSPTYVNGAFGRVPYFVASPLLTNAASATKMGQTILRRVSGMSAQLDLTGIVNPALESGDVISVLLPQQRGERVVVERHIIDTVSIPLTAAGTQSIATRSTRPEGDVPDES